jgi:hypothetical protein
MGAPMEASKHVTTNTTTRFTKGSPRIRALDSKVYGRTAKITNGNQFLPGIDSSLWARRCKDIYNGHLGAVPGATVDQRSHLKRASILEAKLEYLEAQLFDTTKEADAVDTDNAKLDLYQRTAGQHRRALAAAGLKRKKTVVPDVTPPEEDFYKVTLPRLAATPLPPTDESEPI